jgi:tRNA (guanine-N(7)-)-methyltransferase subunit TRM82
MPKRPCAISLSTSGSIIICADKFGDVYSLPLLIDSSLERDAIQTSSGSGSLPDEPKQYISAANDLTVHSARNRRALQNQLKQNLIKTSKVGINVGQQLLLGHVSMLTDIVLAEECGRQYIITADRDEHIRVSRGIPQSHIIESYCLGHSEFVSRLCLTKFAPNVLVSGGGDDDLFVWEWISGNLLQRINISSHIEEVMLREPISKRQRINIGAGDDFQPRMVVVSGIIYLFQGPEFSAGSVAVICEGYVSPSCLQLG